MKGFGLRERNGLIVFLCLVTLLLALGPIADRCGCTRRYEPPAPESVAPDSSKLDSADVSASGDTAVASGARIRKGVSRRRKGVEKSDSVRKRSRKRGAAKSRGRVTPDPQRRNYLDDAI